MAMNVLVETSARHIHLSAEALEVLFGKGATLTNKKELSQPGQFACEEKVQLIGPKGTLTVTVLGPVRPDTQVELSLTDARTLGVSVPVRESGDIEGTPGLKLKGPAGEMDLDKGVIAAMRHIHLTPADAEAFGVKEKQIVKVKLDTPRALIFDNVVVRVSPKFAATMHIDTDESNAACAYGTVYGEILA